MNDRICLEKKPMYIVSFLFIVFLFVLLTQSVLQSNQAKNSRAANIEETAKSVINPADPPSEDQQSPINEYKVSLDNSGFIELLGTPPTIEENKIYSIYLKRGESFVHIDTFIATNTTISERFSYWNPNTKITSDDIQSGTFYFFQVN
ncbi:MAG: hypothetical protein NTZ55_03430 [Candidatus Roizmanbacteria bacterium]|nr:hypothetical protein [Candidatus Roizmanbacteria bacterium]